MSTSTTTLFSTLSLWLFLAVTIANLGFSYAITGQWANQTTHQTRCIPSERETLLEFKKHLKDPSNRLATWDAAATGDDDDCCGWYGVSCHDYLADLTTQYVTGLHLRSLSEFEFYDKVNDGNYYDYYIFGGNVSSVLLSLKHLRYLDLSYNIFRGIRIPSFFGSMKNLRYLNLSNTGFEGIIPHQLGNLSNLQYLNLGSSYGNDADVENLEWMSGLSSLKFLDLSGWNLSKVLNWDKVILTTLPSLLQLHLSNCQLPSPQSHLLNINASSISILDFSINTLGHHPATFLSWISDFKTLNSINIEDNEFTGSIPTQLQNMSSLREVYLGWNSFNSSIPNSLYGHSKLKVLNLGYNLLSSFQPHSSVKNFSFLFVLDLSHNHFQGPIPHEIQNMTSLQKLDLSSNEFRSHIPDWLVSLTHLEHLNLGSNDLEGKIVSFNWNIPSLISLDMSEQSGRKLEFEGGIPKSFKNSCMLRELYLGGVKLRQDINQALEILALPGCVSSGLEELSLSNCQLFGNLATTNQQFSQLMSLKKLDFGFNNLSGTLPVRLGRLEKLQELYLDGNLLSGDVLESHFENLKDLQLFSAYGNHLKLKVNPNWIPPFDKLLFLNLGSWHIGPQFPTWLRSLKKLYSLDLSSSGISSTLPQFIDPMIGMSSNSINSPLPLLPSNLNMLDLSDNLFSGTISKFLCPPNYNSSSMQQWGGKNLQFLYLSQNHLHGEIPDCLAVWPWLTVIDLSNNEFNGTIPESISTLRGLESLHLGNNSLSGEFPRSLNECTKLIAIDVGENELLGNISSFVNGQSLSDMEILILHSNKFSGQLPEKLCHATYLHVLDLANNLFHGIIPSCLGNLSGMTKMDEYIGFIPLGKSVWIPSSWDHRPNMNSRIETTFIQTKGNMLEYSRNLRLLRSLDFSNNKLRGKIPEEITRLYGLISLNLSHNTLSGRIPKNIGFMQKLNSMDFSANQLSGEIPPSISNLTSLDTLNLSHNRLPGRIPSGNQIQTLDDSGFVGNELCGSPLPNNCSNHVVANGPNDEGVEKDEDGDGMIWFYVSMTFGFVGGFWCFLGPMLLNRRWRFAYSQFLDRMWDKIWWKLHRFGMF